VTRTCTKSLGEWCALASAASTVSTGLPSYTIIEPTTNWAISPSRSGLVVNGVTRNSSEIVRLSVTQITSTRLKLTSTCTLATRPVATHDDR
jgi:hypothetical protein